jgi:glycosyltransferase involved in cell wall biosynthesis
LQRGPHAARVLSFARAFEVLRPEVLHAWQDHTNMVAGVAAVMVGVPTIILSGRNVSPIHFPHLFRFYMRETYRGLLGNPHVRMTNNSQGGADDYARWLGVDPQRIAVIRNGVDAAGLRRLQAPEADRFRRECGIPAAAPVVGAVFRFHPEKRPLLWVEVATRVARANDAVHFLLVGNGPMKTAVMNRAAKTGLRRRLHVLAADASVERAFSILDVLLLTSTFEGTPNVAIEAQLLGVPAIVTPGGGSPEVVRDGETGVVVDPPTAENLAAAVLKAVDDHAWRQRAARSGPDFVRERFGADRMIRDTLASYGLAAQRDQ